MGISSKQSGFTMLPLILFMFVIVGLVSAGVMMLGPKVQLGKTVETTKSLDSIANTVILWSASSRTLPPTLQTVFTGGNPLDQWSNNILYLFDNNLTTTPNGGICGRTTTNLNVNGTANTAFALLSTSGDVLQSTWTGLPALSTAVLTYPATVTGTTASLVTGDLFKIVSLEELKNRAGCYGSTQGRLKILNNELPKGCSGSAYSATIFGDGGVSPYQTYTIAGLPAGLSSSGGIISGTPSVTGTFPVSVLIRDSHTPIANTVQKNLNLAIASCGTPPPPGGVVTFNDTFNAGVSGQGNHIAITQDPTSGTVTASAANGTGSACLWYGTPLTLTGKKLRTYFNYTFSSGEGFVLAMIPALANTPPTHCGQGGADLGFDSTIPGNTILGVEFDANRNNSMNDPAYNHLAIDVTSVQHSTTINNACTTTVGGQCYYTSGADTWASNGTQRYHVRVELDATISPYLMKVWLCPVGTGSCSAANISALSTISAAAYSGALSPAITRTLTSTQLSDLGSFIFGFTMSQTGNNNIDLNLAGLTFGTF